MIGQAWTRFLAARADGRWLPRPESRFPREPLRIAKNANRQRIKATDIGWAKAASAAGPPFLVSTLCGEHKTLEQADAEEASIHSLAQFSVASVTSC